MKVRKFYLSKEDLLLIEQEKERGEIPILSIYEDKNKTFQLFGDTWASPCAVRQFILDNNQIQNKAMIFQIMQEYF